MEKQSKPIGWIGPIIIAIGWSLASVGIACLLAMSRAHAHDPGNHMNDGWLRGLYAPYGGMCCNGDDVILGPDWEFTDGHYRVKIDDNWQWVPDSAVIDPHKNRDGVARVWPTQAKMVRCFMPGSQF